MDTIRITVVLFSILLSNVNAADYLPLKEGNQWTYTMSSGMQVTTKVAGFADVGAVRCAIVETTMGWQTSREYVASDGQGVKSYLSQAQGQEFRYDPPLMRIKLPYREGDTWQATVSQMGMTMTTNFQSAGTEQIQTPAGTFECIKVRSTMDVGQGQAQTATIWYADGVGPVHQVLEMPGQAMTITLASTNVKPAPTLAGPPDEPPATPAAQTAAQLRCPKCGASVQAGAKFCPECGTKLEPPKPATPTVCPKCGAKLPAGAKFCPACGEKIVATAAPQPPTAAQTPPQAAGPALERYQSADGRLVLYKPKGWQVREGSMFGQGTYGAVVMEPRENAVALFLTFPVSPEIKDSVALAVKCIDALREEYPDLQASNMHSTPDRGRTMAELTLTEGGEKGIGHGYFFQTQNLGTFYLLLAKSSLWNELRPTLTAIMANLAFAPQGVATVQEQGQRLVAAAPSVDGATLSPAALLKRASQQPGQPVPLQPAALPDGSVSMQIPQGWNLEGQKAQFICVDNPQTRTHGMGFVCHTIIPTQFAVPGTINVPYQPPSRALGLVLELGSTSRDVQVIGECPAEQVSPEVAQAARQLRAQGQQVEARLIHARFRNVPTGATLRGLFSVQCTSTSMSPVWSVSVAGSWAPENEYDQWLPLFIRLEKTTQINQQWMGQEMQNRAFRQQQLNRNLQRSIAESNQAFDDYLGSLQNASRSRDYTAHMWSQTTLGQGTWVAENEGARVYQTDSWGIQGPEGRIDNPAYNTTNFTGQNPWGGGDLELVDTRAEYERYLANR